MNIIKIFSSTIIHNHILEKWTRLHFKHIKLIFKFWLLLQAVFWWWLQGISIPSPSLRSALAVQNRVMSAHQVESAALMLSRMAPIIASRDAAKSNGHTSHLGLMPSVLSQMIEANLKAAIANWPIGFFQPEASKQARSRIRIQNPTIIDGSGAFSDWSR